VPNRRPAETDYDAMYASYVSAVPEGDVVEFLGRQRDDAMTLLGSIPAERAGFRYAPGKWSIAEVVGHVIDAEWIFTTRALRFARGDETPLPGFDSDEYAVRAGRAGRSLASLAEELRHLRSANLALFSSFDEAALDRRGTAWDRSFTVRAKLFIIAGHAQHHMAVLRERYL